MHLNESESGPTTKATDPPEDSKLLEHVQAMLDDWREKRISGEELAAVLDRLGDEELRKAVRVFGARTRKLR
jgi:hypothetical protein